MLRFATVNYIFGPPGSGKSTTLAYLASYFRRKHVRIYSNVEIAGTILIKDEDLGFYDMSGSVILLDEAGLSMDARSFKNGYFSVPERLRFWKKVRHRNSMIFLATQGWDECDKKARTLSQAYFCISKSLIPGVTVIRPLFKHSEIDENTHQPADFFTYGGRFSTKRIIRRLYYKYFDSYECEPLPDYPDREHYIPLPGEKIDDADYLEIDKDDDPDPDSKIDPEPNHFINDDIFE